MFTKEEINFIASAVNTHTKQYGLEVAKMSAHVVDKLGKILIDDGKSKEDKKLKEKEAG